MQLSGTIGFWLEIALSLMMGQKGVLLLRFAAIFRDLVAI
jgi:hypothetical protein